MWVFCSLLDRWGAHFGPFGVLGGSLGALLGCCWRPGDPWASLGGPWGLLGRIEDVDIAEESANLAKYSILTQAAAAMVAQANTTNDVALMLLR